MASTLAGSTLQGRVARAAGALVAVLALAALLWTDFNADESAPAILSPAAVAAVPAPAASAVKEPAAIVRDLAPAWSTVHGTDEVEVCGIGWLAAAANGQPDEAQLAQVPGLADARREIGGAMAASPDDYTRGVALWLGLSGDALSAEERLDRLARAASTSTDPRLYAMAFRACLRETEGGCAMLSAEQWARVDEGNAMPWLYLLGSAAARGDEAARDDALFHVSVARRIEDRTFGAPAVVVEHAGDDDRGLLAARMMSAEAIAVSSAQEMPLQTLMQSCRGEPLPDPNRGQVCSAIADLMVARSDSLPLRAAGAALVPRPGGDATGPDKRQAGLSPGTASIADAWSSATSFACGDLRQLLGRLRAAGKIGSVATLPEQGVTFAHRSE